MPRRVGVALAAAITAAALTLLAPTLTPTAPTPAVPTSSPSPRWISAIYQQIGRTGTAGRIQAEAPIFAWATPEGKLTNLEDLRGHPVVINFWATWCVPCRKEMPALEAVATRRPDIAFLEIDLQEDPEAIVAFIDSLGGLPHLQPVLDPRSETARRYGVFSLPTTFFVDPLGVIQHIEIGGPMSEEKIEKGIAKADGTP